MKAVFALFLSVSLLLLPATSTEAAGWSPPGAVTKIEIVRGQGLVVFGSFDNVNSCTATSGFWVKYDHPQYDEIYALMLTAMTSGLRVQPYLGGCEAIGWHAGSWNIVDPNGAVYLLP